MYKQATKMGLRFSTGSGRLSVEDLWTLPLTSRNKLSLDKIAIAVSTEIRQTAQESFVENVSTAGAKELELKLEILKDIIATRQADNKARTDATSASQTKDRIRNIIASKQDDALQGKTIEELTALL